MRKLIEFLILSGGDALPRNDKCYVSLGTNWSKFATSQLIRQYAHRIVYWNAKSRPHICTNSNEECIVS